jgi:hypothetical protein
MSCVRNIRITVSANASYIKAITASARNSVRAGRFPVAPTPQLRQSAPSASNPTAVSDAMLGNQAMVRAASSR